MLNLFQFRLVLKENDINPFNENTKFGMTLPQQKSRSPFGKRLFIIL